MNDRSKVIVALDGSDGALQALDWACRYARMAGVDVEAVHVWGYPEPGLRTGVSEPYAAMQLEAMETMRDQITRYTDEHHPGVGIHARVVEGSVVEALADESHRAELMVVGSRGHHHGPVAIMGSVSRGVAERAACPVVIVHPRDRVAVGSPSETAHEQGATT